MNIGQFFIKNSDLKKDEKILLIFLLGCRFHGKGVFHVSLKAMAQATSIGTEALKSVLLSLSEKGRLAYDFENEICWLFELDVEPEFIPTNSRIYELACDSSGLSKTEALSLFKEAVSLTLDYQMKNNSASNAIAEIRVKKKRGRPRKIETEEQHKTDATSTGNPVDSSESEDWMEVFFDEFWAIYPRKNAKADALKAMKSVLKKVKGEALSLRMNAIMFGVKAFAEEIQTKGTQKEFIRLAGTWLRAENWEDYKDTPTLLTEEQKSQLAKWHAEFVSAYPKKAEEKKTKQAFARLKERVLHEPGFAEQLVKKAKEYADNFAGKEHYAQCPAAWLDSKGWERAGGQMSGLQSTMLQNNFTDYGFQSTVSSDLMSEMDHAMDEALSDELELPQKM
jgi:hypothetical protein